MSNPKNTLQQLEQEHKNRMDELDQLWKEDPEFALQVATRYLMVNAELLEELGHEVDYGKIFQAIEQAAQSLN